MNYKSKFIHVTFLLFMLQLNVEAQKHPQLRYIGFDAGLNMAGISSASQYDINKKNFGLNISLSANYSFSDSKSVGASLCLEQKGAIDYVYDIKTNLNYVTLPVYWKQIIGKEPRFFINAGVSPGWLISANKQGDKILDGQLNRVNEDVTDNFKSFDFGLLLGAGMMVRLYDEFDFIVKMQGTAGLINVNDYLPGSSPKNYHINISIGYIYYIGFR